MKIGTRSRGAVPALESLEIRLDLAACKVVGGGLSHPVRIGSDGVAVPWTGEKGEGG